MTLEERLAHHKAMAESYHMAYVQQDVQDGATYDEWKFAPHAIPDWAPLDFKCWASEDGFVMQSHFGGHDKDGVLHDFYAYGFVNTNEDDEIVHWETHVSPEYNDFLDFTLGVHGPFKHGAGEYMQAVGKRLAQAGMDLDKERAIIQAADSCSSEQESVVFFICICLDEHTLHAAAPVK